MISVPLAHHDADPLAELTQRLGGPPPAGIVALGPQVTGDVLAALREARARQAAELDAALHGTLKRLPRPLRSVARRILGA
jgi:hypothetical protein